MLRNTQGSHVASNRTLYNRRGSGTCCAPRPNASSNWQGGLPGETGAPSCSRSSASWRKTWKQDVADGPTSYYASRTAWKAAVRRQLKIACPAGAAAARQQQELPCQAPYRCAASSSYPWTPSEATQAQVSWRLLKVHGQGCQRGGVRGRTLRRLLLRGQRGNSLLLPHFLARSTVGDGFLHCC